MKEGNQFARDWIYGADVRTFIAIAAQTRERKVGRVCCTTVLQGNDVIWFVSMQGNCLGKQTVFAPAAGSFRNEST